MNRLTTLGLGLVVMSLLVAMACAPTGAPSPASAPVPAAAPQPAAPAVSPEAAGSAEVVAAAKKEGKLTHYTYYFFSDIGLAAARAFKEKYGITIEHITGRGAEFNERIATEQRTRQYTGDILDSSPAWSNRAKERGYNISLLDLPVLREKGVWVMDPVVDRPDGHILAFAPNPIPVIINTDLVKPAEEPRSWNDLLDPKWKGKIGLNDPLTSSGPDILISYMTNHKALDLEYFRKLGQQELVWIAGGSKGTVESVARGETAVGLMASITTLSVFLREGAPIKVLDLKEGRVLLTQTISALKNAPHPNTSKLFLNWLLSQEGQAVYSRATGTVSMRTDVPSSMPRGWVPATTIVPETLQDVQDSTQAYRDQVAAKLLRRR